MQSPRSSRWIAPLAVGLVVSMAAAAVFAADPPAAPSARPVLHLSNGGYAPGVLVATDQPDVLRWGADAFMQPLDFATTGVNSIHWPPPSPLPKPVGTYCFELAAGDVVYGNLVDLNDREAVIDVPKSGRLTVQRSAIKRIDRWRDSADLVYSGPNGMTGWKEPVPKEGWREDSAQPVSDKPGSVLKGDFALPARAMIEFELSWKSSKPDFVLALGVAMDDTPKPEPNVVNAHRRFRVISPQVDRTSFENAFRIEVWDNEIIAQRETEIEADLAAIQPLTPGSGRVHLQAYLDQEKGRLTVFSTSGKPLADLQIATSDPRVLPGISLTNLKGDVRLERLRITKWNGEAPREARSDLARIQKLEGEIVYGQISRYDAQTKEFIVQGDGDAGESRVPEDSVTAVFLSPVKDEADRSIRAVYQDGSRLSGDLVKITSDQVWLKVPGIAETAHLPIDGLRSLVVVKREPASKDKDEHSGRLEMDGLLLPGRLAESPGSGALAWLPDGSASAGALREGVSGKIIYKDPPPTKPATATSHRVRIIRPAPANVAQGFLRALTDAPPSQAGPQGGRRAIHLRTGDIIPSEISKIDENGVTFKTALSDSTFVPNEKIKAVELALGGVSSVKLNKSKHERLLTLPRMQKESPPTHMVRALNGDYLRGRVVSMDDKTLEVEVSLENKKVPRNRISRIIWLHPDEVDPTKAPAKDPNAKASQRVQALRSDGIRLTFVPEKFAEGTLTGKSDVLGTCRVSMKDVDQLLIGSAIEQAALQTAYGPWRLKNAVEPKIATDDGEGGSERSPGTESALVGKPAPDFKLDIMDGKPFKLSENKGKVIVLDFWATWCGPCLQAMPQIEKVADEFKDKGVQLIAVNLQETPKEIKAMLERHKLHPTVALDQDGVVADRYAANAIPQTVVIDKEGKITRLFIGGSAKLGDQLREALNEALAPPKPKEPVKE